MRMTLTRGIGSVALVIGVLVSGCSGGGTAGDGTSSASESPSDYSLPSEALAPAPSIRSGTDARTLLRPDGDLYRLSLKAGDDLHELESLHVEQHSNADGNPRFSFDVDDDGRCSGELDEGGVHYRFVTTDNGRLLLTTDEGKTGQRLAGRWVESSNAEFPGRCQGGPSAVIYGADRVTGVDWLLPGTKRIGDDRVAGRSAVHFRHSGRKLTIDSWIAPDESTARLLKLVVRHQNGDVLTQRFSRFDSAGPVAPEPPADAVLPPGETAA